MWVYCMACFSLAIVDLQLIKQLLQSLMSTKKATEALWSRTCTVVGTAAPLLAPTQLAKFVTGMQSP